MRENIEIFHRLSPDEYVRVLKSEYGAREHPVQPNGYLIDDPELPFYKPEQLEDHVSVLGFNGAPLSSLLLQAIIDHPELVPDEVLVRWTEEQDLVIEKTLGEFRSEKTSPDGL